MANWITHTRIADILLNKNLNLDETSFCIGNIAPDCNVENEDWSAYIPSREITHFMSECKKTSCDAERFFYQYIQNKTFETKEEYSFLLGYYSHLITDVEFQRMIRDENRIQNCFKRIKENDEMNQKIVGLPENFDSLKKVFGKWNILADIIELENEYIKSNPTCSYNKILRNVNDFPDYLDFFPKKAINRKIPIMIHEYDEWSTIQGSGFYFFSKEEYDAYLEKTANKIYEQFLLKRTEYGDYHEI